MTSGPQAENSSHVREGVAGSQNGMRAEGATEDDGERWQEYRPPDLKEIRCLLSRSTDVAQLKYRASGLRLTFRGGLIFGAVGSIRRWIDGDIE